MAFKKSVRIALVVLSVLFALGTSWWAWRWVLPPGEPFYRALAYTSLAVTLGPYGSPEGTNRIRITYFYAGACHHAYVVHKHWLYGARELASGYLWDAYGGEKILEVIWDSETSFRVMGLLPNKNADSPVTIKIDLDK